MTLTAAQDRIGQKVVYRAPHVSPDRPGEEGVITSVGDIWVYVRFGADAHSKATHPSQLTAVTA